MVKMFILKSISIKEGILYLIAILIAFSTFSGVFNLGTEVYVGVCLLFTIVSLFKGTTSITIGSWKVVGFVLICVISILINNPPSYFRVWERLLGFLNMLIAFSPLIVCRSMNRARSSLYDKMMKIMVFFSVASFVGYFLGVNYFIREGAVLAYNEAGHFSGFANHSMVLAPISAMGGLYALTMALTNKKREKFKWWVITLACFGAVLLSASRGALGGAIFAIIIVIYKLNKGRMGRSLKYSMIGIAVVALSFPLWGGLTQYVVEKNDYNMYQGGVAFSRETKMAARFYEIKHNFVTGVGFSVVDETVDYVDHSTGTVEPNSSWLGVFSMTGVFGLFLFLAIFIHAFITAYHKVNNPQLAILLCGILSFYFLHMMIEGYILAAGNILCGLYWLTIGVVYANCEKKVVK